MTSSKPKIIYGNICYFNKHNILYREKGYPAIITKKGLCFYQYKYLRGNSFKEKQLSYKKFAHTLYSEDLWKYTHDIHGKSFDSDAIISMLNG